MTDIIIDPENLADAIQDQLDLFVQEKVSAINSVGQKAIKKLVKLTKAAAPKRKGNYAKAITHTAKPDPVTGLQEFTWGARAPFHRLTHLLVHGHEAKDGGRVAGDPFLQNALDVVLPEYEVDVEEVLHDD